MNVSSNKIIFIIFLGLLFNLNFLTAFPVKSQNSSTNVDTLTTQQQAYLFVRGIERDEQPGFRPFYTLKKTVLFIPEQFSVGIKYASGYGVELLNNPKFINDLEYIFFTQDKSLGWYPTLSITSGLRPRIGVNFLIKHAPYQFVVKAKFADEEKYKTEARFSYFRKKQEKLFRLNIELLHEYDDDRKYYGFGANPRTDNRNQFINSNTAKYGYFFQEHTAFKIISGFKPVTQFSLFYTTAFEQRILKNPFEGGQRINSIFIPGSIPGMDCIFNHWTNEFSVRYNSQNENRYLSGGTFIETFVKISKGLGNDNNLSASTGITALKRFSVLQNNRILTPRFTIYSIKNLDAEHAIPFTEYPHHSEFRGVNDRTFLRLDNHLLIPSLQYSWPLSQNIGAHIFTDYLTSGYKWSKLSFNNAPWAAGFILDLHSVNEELANVKMIYGSEGWRFHAEIGVSLY